MKSSRQTAARAFNEPETELENIYTRPIIYLTWCQNVPLIGATFWHVIYSTHDVNRLYIDFQTTPLTCNIYIKHYTRVQAYIQYGIIYNSVYMTILVMVRTFIIYYAYSIGQCLYLCSGLEDDLRCWLGVKPPLKTQTLSVPFTGVPYVVQYGTRSRNVYYKLPSSTN